MISETEHYTCIACPIGCPLRLEHEGNEIKEISGHSCNRGAKYAHQEFTDPRRALSTTVTISGSLWERLPVKTTGPILKNHVMEAAREIHRLRIDAPVQVGQVLIEDFMDEKGINVVACRSMPRITLISPGHRKHPSKKRQRVSNRQYNNRKTMHKTHDQ